MLKTKSAQLLVATPYLLKNSISRSFLNFINWRVKWIFLAFLMSGEAIRQAFYSSHKALVFKHKSLILPKVNQILTEKRYIPV